MKAARCLFFFSSRRRHTRYWRDWSSDVCSSDLVCSWSAGEPQCREGRISGAFEIETGRSALLAVPSAHQETLVFRSGERRVGEECRSRWSPDHLKKKQKIRISAACVLLITLIPL